MDRTNFSNTVIVRDGQLELTGTASDPDGDPVSYQILLFDAKDPNGTPLFNVTPGPLNPQGFHEGAVNNASLGTADLSTIENGNYNLKLLVRGGGDEATTNLSIALDSNLKIGQFSFSEQDLILPVSGIPLSITRTYNSLNPRTADFGYSWSFALNSMDVQLDEWRQPTEDVDLANEKFSLRVGGGRDVTLTLPDGRRTAFQFYFDGPHSCYNDPSAKDCYFAKWQAPLGVNYELKANADVYYNALTGYWNNSAGTGFENYDIPGFVLTARDGTIYNIHREPEGSHFFDTGFNDGYFVDTYGPPKLVSIVQRNTNSIVIQDNGIFHRDPTNGLTREILFDRDGASRITAIYDPNGGATPLVQYIYNQDTGNLLQVVKLVDRAAGTSTTVKYHYDHPRFRHYITSIESPRGVPIARNEYDDSGRLTAVVDADGKRTEFTHDTTGKKEVIIDRLGHTNVFVYDLRGNVTAQTNALSQVTLMAYDDTNNKTNDVVYLDNQPYSTNSYVYDANNFLLGTVNPLGFTNGFTYDGFGNVLTSTDARGVSSTNFYDPGTGNLTASTDALGHGSTNFYDGNSLMLGSVDAIGTRTTNFYDGSENLTGTATFSGSTILSTNTFAYDLDGNRTSSVVWRQVPGVSGWVSATTTYIYDAQNRVTQTIDPDGGTNTVVYNEIGKQQATIDKLGHTNSYEYDFQGRMFRTTYADGSQESSGYDASGNRTTSVDRGIRTTTFYYDALSRVTNTVYADSTANTTVYDGVGRVARTIDARGTITAFAYDAAGRRLAVTNAVGTSVATTNFFGYDAIGNQPYATNALGFVTTNVFDVLNRQIQTLFPDGTTNTTVYDTVGRRIQSVDQAGIISAFVHDGAGRLTWVTNAVGKAEQMVTGYEYDEAGNLLRQIDALKRTNSFAYDGMGRRISHTMPGSQVEGFTYDHGGNLQYQTNFNGITITNEYDVLNRLTHKKSADGYAVSYAYSVTGQRTNMIDPSGSTAYLYDDRDRLTNKLVNWGSASVALSVSLNYRYDAGGNLTGLWSGSANGVTNFYQYDALSRLTNVLANGNAAAGYRYDLNGNLQAMSYRNGVTNFYQYDSLNRLTNVVWRTNGTTIASFVYQLGLTGNRTNVTEFVKDSWRTNQWQYDPLYRLTNETIKVGVASDTLGYRYDSVSNRTNRTASAGLSTLLPGGSSAFTTNDWLTTDLYDSNGNTRTNGTQPYFYDVENRLTNFNNGALIIGYNGDGLRVRKTNSTSHVTTFYLVDDRNPSGYAQVLEEWTDSGGGASLSKVYTYGLDLISQQVPGVGTNFFGYDGHGSTRFLTGLTRCSSNTFAYDAYGTLIASNSSPQTVYLYCGEQFDPDLGFYYLRARYLNPTTGRFWTMDSLDGHKEDPATLHKYLYCRSNPVMGVDPSGHDDLIGLTESIGSSLIAGPFAPIALEYQRGVFSNPNKEQLPNSSDTDLEANDHSVFISNTSRSVDTIFQNIAHLNVDRHIAIPSDDNLPVSGVGNRIKWTPGSLKMAAGQAPFYVTVKKFVNKSGQEGEGDHFFSVVTMGGHPLAGWRFWRVFRISGGIVVQTGAVDKPARWFGQLGNGVFGARSDVLNLWKFQMQDALGRDTQGSGPFDHIDGEYEQSHKEEFLRLVQ